MEKFLEELTELTLKHKMVICGDGVYSHFKIEKCSENLTGKYVGAFDENKVEWLDD